MISSLAPHVTSILEDDLAFRTWLSTKPSSEIIGRSGCMRDCPIAAFLRSVFIDAYFEVYGLSLMIDYISSCEFVNLPWWVGKFVTRLDLGVFEGNRYRPVTVHDALLVLDLIKAA